jgi:hypothetical protein
MRKLTTPQAAALLLCMGIGGYAFLHGLPTTPVNDNQTSTEYKLSTNHWHRQVDVQPVPTSTASLTPTRRTVPQSSATPVQDVSLTVPQETQGSGNWAGYIVSPKSSSHRYTSVSGSWTVPNITGNAQSIAAQWIGLGGVSSTDLLQMGTLEQFENGRPVAEVFWEKLPAAAQEVMTVPFGSTIHASISKASGSTWNIAFTAHTPAGQTLSKTIPVKLDATYAKNIGTSAEWINEDPSDDNGNLYPLANTGEVQFNSTLVDGHALNNAENEVQPVALVSDTGRVLMVPSALALNGESFTTATVSTNTGYGRNRMSHRAWGHWQAQGWGNDTDYSVGYSYVAREGFGSHWR